MVTAILGEYKVTAILGEYKVVKYLLYFKWQEYSYEVQGMLRYILLIIFFLTYSHL